MTSLGGILSNQRKMERSKEGRKERRKEERKDSKQSFEPRAKINCGVYLTFATVI